MDEITKIETQDTNLETISETEEKKESEFVPFYTEIELPFDFSYEGKTYKTLTFDWKKLTGKDFAQAEWEMSVENNRLLAFAPNDGDFIMRLAVRASVEGISKQALEALPLHYYNLVRMAGRVFLLMPESQAEKAYGSINNV